MSRPAYTLAFRSGVRVQRAPWLCRRCLATQASSSSSRDATVGLSPLSPDEITEASSELAALSSPTAQQPRPRWVGLKNLSQPLPHRLPPAYLRLCDPQALTPEEREHQKRVPASKTIRGVVVSAGKMDKTVKMRVAGQRWNKKIGKVRVDGHSSTRSCVAKC